MAQGQGGKYGTEDRVRKALASEHPLRAAWLLGDDSLITNLIFFDLYAGGLLEREDARTPVPNAPLAYYCHQYRLKRGVDLGMLNPWEARVARAFSQGAGLAAVAEHLKFSDLALGEAPPDRPRDPEAGNLLERFLSVRAEALAQVETMC